VGRYGTAWKVRVTAAPEAGKANDAVLELLARTLDLPRSRFALVSGHSSREKIVVLDGVEQEQTERLLDSAGRTN